MTPTCKGCGLTLPLVGRCQCGHLEVGETLEEHPLTVDQEDRAVALAVARDLLLVKGGKYAERPLDPFDMIRLAEWILGDDEDEPTFADAMDLPVDAPLTMQQARVIRRALAAYDRMHG